jgi:hypothetical protein
MDNAHFQTTLPDPVIRGIIERSSYYPFYVSNAVYFQTARVVDFPQAEIAELLDAQIVDLEGAFVAYKPQRTFGTIKAGNLKNRLRFITVADKKDHCAEVIVSTDKPNVIVPVLEDFDEGSVRTSERIALQLGAKDYETEARERYGPNYERARKAVGARLERERNLAQRILLIGQDIAGPEGVTMKHQYHSPEYTTLVENYNLSQNPIALR